MVVSTDWTSIASRLWSQRRDTLLKDTVTCECPSSVPAPWRGQVATKAKPGLTQRHAEERRGKELSASLCESLRLCVKSSQARGRPAPGRERRGRRCRRGCSGRRCPHQEERPHLLAQDFRVEQRFRFKGHLPLERVCRGGGKPSGFLGGRGGTSNIER